MGWKSFNPFGPRIEMRGYPESLYDQVQLNPSIYRWDLPTFLHDPSSVSTDYLIPHVETWDYPARPYVQIQDNPLIHQWDNTAHTYHLLSVLTGDRVQTQTRGEC